MSLLSPVLLPPKVKAYLSQGERFIKWDDVSGALGWWWGGCCQGLCWGAGLVYVCWDQVPVWLGRAAATTAWINKPGGEGVCP